MRVRQQTAANNTTGFVVLKSGLSRSRCDDPGAQGHVIRLALTEALFSDDSGQGKKYLRAPQLHHAKIPGNKDHYHDDTDNIENSAHVRLLSSFLFLSCFDTRYLN